MCGWRYAYGILPEKFNLIEMCDLNSSVENEQVI